ncbi:MAG: FAD-binding domain-containing protein [Bacteroidales bacterium]|nr:FAD-binding domain-containing protein [Bacteroidales bacterium]
MSPYISRGVISTRQLYLHIKSLGLPWYKTEKLIQELAWRDYWQQVWIEKKDAIKVDLKNKQSHVTNYKIPKAIVNANTGIKEIDYAIKNLYETGYMHNHMRMYVASICCNIANSHWLEPAKWMYSNLLDGDLASNHLSWQWVAGSFSNKKYFANQNNINKYFNSFQKNTFLDLDYEAFENITTPTILQENTSFDVSTKLPLVENPILDKNKTSLIYNFYNIDPNWYKNKDMQRIFLMEPSFFIDNPVSKNVMNFIMKLTKNIKEIKIFIGEFSSLEKYVNTNNLYYKEHPTNNHYKGNQEDREWISSIKGYYPSFFGYWKKIKKEMTQ